MILYIRNIDYIDIFATSNKGYTIKNNINDISVFARSCQIMLSIINLIRRDIQDILYFPGSAGPPAPAPCGVVWCGCGLLPPSLWYGVVRVRFLAVPPLPVLWCGGGWVVPPLYNWICLGWVVNLCSR